ncbi:hypothetical protein D3C76_1546170 [compost metagenome]
MEHRRGQGAVNVRITKRFQKVFHGARAAGGNQGYLAYLTDLPQLFQIVTVAYAILVHHVQHNLAGTAFLHFFNPIQGFPLGDAGAAFVAGVLVNVILAG